MGVRMWLAVSLVGWCIGAGAGNAEGQEGPYAFQIRGGGTLPVAGFKDDARGWEQKAGRGPSLGMGFTFPLHGVVGGYLGFSQYRFACDEDVCPSGSEWISTGFDVALRMVLGDRRIRPWIQGGIHTPRIEGWVLEEGQGSTVHSGGGGGYEVGGGILVKAGERMSLSPGLRYGSADVPFTARPMMALRYLVLDLGLVVGF